MTIEHTADYIISLVRELSKLPQETEWVEFKHNYAEPHDIGEYISALANSAALVGKAFAYVVWGVNDGDHAIVGTQFSPRAAKVGNEELENWLLRALSPKIHFRFFEVQVDGLPVVLLEIERAFRQPFNSRGMSSSALVRTRNDSKIFRRRSGHYGVFLIRRLSRTAWPPSEFAMRMCSSCWTILPISTY